MKAEQDLQNILSYLKDEWGDSVKQEFKVRMKRRLTLIGKFPLLHKSSEIKPEFRVSVLSKQTSIIYSVQKSTISIIRLFDNRQDPGKLELQ